MDAGCTVQTHGNEWRESGRSAAATAALSGAAVCRVIAIVRAMVRVSCAARTERLRLVHTESVLGGDGTRALRRQGDAAVAALQLRRRLQPVRRVWRFTAWGWRFGSRRRLAWPKQVRWALVQQNRIPDQVQNCNVSSQRKQSPTRSHTVTASGEIGAG